ncbi:CAP domain-containing protein [bacterium]|nr:CAP domain-containing protein [bacterium]
MPAGLWILCLAFLCVMQLAACGSGTSPGRPPGGGPPQISYSPPITLPPAESYRNLAAPGASAGRRWLDNSYATLPQNGNPFQNDSLRAWATEIRTRINTARGAAGLRMLQHSPLLERTAQAHARDMALRDYFSHTTPEGLSIWDRLELVGAPAYGAGGETNARGQESASGVVSGWLSSASHRSILLNPELTHIGVGVYFDRAGGSEPIHVTALLLEYR